MTKRRTFKDIGDEHQLKILSDDETFDLFLNFFTAEKQVKMRRTFEIVTDINEQIAYLRSSVIGHLIDECSRVFVENESLLLEGKLEKPLIKLISDTPANAYKDCSKIAFSRLYKSSDVVDIEIAGHQIISFLLDKFIDAVNNPEKAYSKLLLDRIPDQYEIGAQSKYGKVMAILDYISGMTDIYALDLYRKLYGMSLPSL